MQVAKRYSRSEVQLSDGGAMLFSVGLPARHDWFDDKVGADGLNGGLLECQLTRSLQSGLSPPGAGSCMVKADV